ESRSQTSRSVRYGGYAVIILLLIYFTSLPKLTGYVDLTSNNRRTLTENSQKIIKKLKETNNEGDPLTITTYINLLDYSYFIGLPSSRNRDLHRWDKLRRFFPHMKMKYVYYYDTPANDRMLKNKPDKTKDEIVEDVVNVTSLTKDEILTPQ